MAFSWVSGEEEMVVVVEKLVDVVLDSSSVELRRGGGGLGVGKCFFLHGLVGKREKEGKSWLWKSEAPGREGCW